MKIDQPTIRALLQDLISIKSPVGAETTIIQYLQQRLQSSNYSVTVGTASPELWDMDHEGSPPLMDKFYEPEFIVAYPPVERDSGLLLFAHYDTEFPNSVDQFFDVTEDDTRYYGHGIADDKAGIAAILLSVENVINNKGSSLPAVVFAQAKHGGCFGMSEAIKSVKGRYAAIYAHPAESNAGFAQIKTASRGIATFTIKFFGLRPPESEENTPASADPRLGESALALAALCIQEITSWNDSDVVWLVSDLEVTNRDYQVPDACSLRVSAWFTSIRVDEVSQLLSERLKTLVLVHPSLQQPEVEITGIRANPAETIDRNFVATVKSVISKHTGKDVLEYEWHAASDIRFPLLHLQIPAVGFGCLAGGFYGGKEWIDKESFVTFVDILMELSQGYL